MIHSFKKIMNINKSPRKITKNTIRKKKNPVAMLLRSSMYKSKIKTNIKIYNRKKSTIKS